MSKHVWPLKSLRSGRNAVTLFEIRLDNNFIVFRGNGCESAGQLLKGHVVLCLSSALKVEEVHLRLTGTLRLTFTQTKVTPSGVAQHKVDKTTHILQHLWKPFVGGHGKGVVLQAGNYEFPFEHLLPGNTSETLEGIPEASISYRLKARVVRGRLTSDIHTYRHVRVIRTLEPSALELLHAMSVENIWPNKVEYSIVIPQKAVIFGGTLPLQMRLTPLLKGLEIGDIQAKLLEVRECSTNDAFRNRQYKTEREVGRWKFNATRQHWHDDIGDTGQDGWVLEKKLDLPKRLRQCVQDMTQHGIKIRHKLKLTIALKNPDGHISELRATLPVSIFISPNIPLDDEGNMVPQLPGENDLISEEEVAAPPGYGQHVLDQLYEDVVFGGFQTPDNQSGTNSPYYQRSALPSALTSAEDLTVMRDLPAVRDANPDTLTTALATRLQSVREARVREARSRRNSVVSLESAHGQQPQSAGLSRQTSNEEPPSSPEGAEHIDDLALLGNLNKVPSYATALRTPARPRSVFGVAMTLPMYEDIEPESARHGGVGPSGASSSDAAVSPHARPSRSAAAGSRARAVSLATGRESYRRERSERAGTERGSSQTPVAESTRPHTARARPMSGYSESLVQRLSGHGYAHHRLGSRTYLGGQDLQCI